MEQPNLVKEYMRIPMFQALARTWLCLTEDNKKQLDRKMRKHFTYSSTRVLYDSLIDTLTRWEIMRAKCPTATPARRHQHEPEMPLFERLRLLETIMIVQRELSNICGFAWSGKRSGGIYDEPEYSRAGGSQSLNPMQQGRGEEPRVPQERNDGPKPETGAIRKKLIKPRKDPEWDY